MAQWCIVSSVKLEVRSSNPFAERFLVLQSLLDPWVAASSTYHEVLRSIANSAHGYTAADLTALVKQANTRMTNEQYCGW